MNKKTLLAAATLFVSQLTIGVAPAQAYCLQLVNFCDKIELFVDMNKNLYGRWNWDCGLEAADMLGAGTTVAGDVDALSTIYSWRIKTSNQTVDLWFIPHGIGAAPALLVPAGQPYTV